MMQKQIKLVKSFECLFTPARYKVFYGGRGGAKSWNIALALLVISMQKKVRILCAREYQSSIRDSVYRLLSDRIDEFQLNTFFSITQTNIMCNITGAEFIFKGLHHNISEIKSIQGIDICWIEEAHNVSRFSWDILKPTIRAENSEIWVSFNPLDEDSPTYQDFVVNAPKEAIVKKINYTDNPFFPEVMRLEMEHTRTYRPDDFAHIWMGEPRTISEAQIFKGKFHVTAFEVPKDKNLRWFVGVDWGFSKDPVAATFSYVKDDCLYIAYEVGGIGVELDEIPALLDSVPGSLARKWAIKADSSRPETISHIKTKGFNIKGAKKWGGSVEDGISHLKNFKTIYIHQRCKHTASEFNLYSYKVDKQTEDVLPIIVDKHNHYIDSLRYALDGYIQRKNMSINRAFAEALS